MLKLIVIDPKTKEIEATFLTEINQADTFKDELASTMQGNPPMIELMLETDDNYVMVPGLYLANRILKLEAADDIKSVTKANATILDMKKPG
jgi:hypothetical protein